MKAAFYTLGCKVNQYETQEMTEQLTRNGFLVVDAKEDADVYIINSCTVTAESNRKTRQAVRKFRTNHPCAVIVLTGCVPQAFPEEALSLQEADIVLGNKNNFRLAESIRKFISEHKRVENIEQHGNHDPYTGGIITEFSGHTRAFIKIQDGCNRFCSYCVIPVARGRSRSKKEDDILREVEGVAAKGFSEVVFVGINLSAYGHDCGTDIGILIEKASHIDGIKRIRLGSLEPDHLTDDIIDRISKIDKFCPQFHISLQSGCDTVLKRMNRHYDSSEYEALAEKLRAAFKETSLTTDIIVGFPDETDEEFNTTVEFAKKIGFEKVHVFPYSPREGTRAALTDGQVEKSVKEERASILADVCEEIRKRSFEKMNGTVVSVLFERPKDGCQCGYTKNYTPVRVKTDEKLTGTIRNVIITQAADEYCTGELI